MSKSVFFFGVIPSAHEEHISCRSEVSLSSWWSFLLLLDDLVFGSHSSPHCVHLCHYWLRTEGKSNIEFGSHFRFLVEWYAAWFTEQIGVLFRGHSFCSPRRYFVPSWSLLFKLTIIPSTPWWFSIRFAFSPPTSFISVLDLDQPKDATYDHLHNISRAPHRRLHSSYSTNCLLNKSTSSTNKEDTIARRYYARWFFNSPASP